MARIYVIPDEGMDDDTRRELMARLETDACRWCGGLHQKECPRIRKITYNPSDDRMVREVEFWADGEWNSSGVIFPEDLV